jgi:uncharacterized membrane protein (TIGR02234 family)
MKISEPATSGAGPAEASGGVARGGSELDGGVRSGRGADVGRGSGGGALAGGVIAAVVGAALILFDTSAHWIVVRVSGASTRAGTGEATAATFRVALSGAASVPALDALGLVALAGAGAVFATRRWGRVAVGVVLVAVAIGVVIATLTAVTDPTAIARRSTDVRQIAPDPTAIRSVALTVAAWLPLPGAVLIGLGGIAVAMRARNVGGLSRRHTTPDRSPERRPADAWEAIERGEDPTS